jgi:HAD superfamily hydrolase (TIGR01509 family)
VFFDAGGVLYDREFSTTDFLRRTLESRGHDPGVLRVRRTELADLHREATLGRISAEENWERAIALCGIDGTERAEIRALIFEFADAIRPAADARPTFAELGRRGHKLGVITNTVYSLERKMRWLERVGVSDLLDVVSCSSALGIAKPDPAIYRGALDRTGVSAREAVFVGHSAEELAGARAVGMATVGINEDPGAAADHHVDTLADLTGLPIL